jgi:hypothetical protein
MKKKFKQKTELYYVIAKEETKKKKNQIRYYQQYPETHANLIKKSCFPSSNFENHGSCKRGVSCFLDFDRFTLHLRA